MFTGLIEGMGNVIGVARSKGDMILNIRPLYELDACQIGESIAVNGACLTVTALKENDISMDVSGETLTRTTLGNIKQGDKVNLERALKLSDRLGGHLVQGHVDGIGKIQKIDRQQRYWLIRIGIDQALFHYTIEKGSVAVDGISLTINSCQDGYFDVSIIPETARQTTILKKKVGDLVNIETDIIAKYVEKFLMKERFAENSRTPSGIDRKMLEKFGFGD
jgi:riboflavin synthase